MFPMICTALLLCSSQMTWPTPFMVAAKWSGRLAMPIFMFHYGLHHTLQAFQLPGALNGAKAWDGSCSREQLGYYFLILFSLAFVVALIQPHVGALVQKMSPGKE